MKISAWFARRKQRSQFPSKIIGHWYCGAWYLHNDQPWPVEGKVMFNPHICGFWNAKNSSGLVEGLIPALRRGDLVGLYRVESRYRIPGMGSDLACWDDGRKVDLKLVKVVKGENV